MVHRDCSQFYCTAGNGIACMVLSRLIGGWNGNDSRAHDKLALNRSPTPANRLQDRRRRIRYRAQCLTCGCKHVGNAANGAVRPIFTNAVINLPKDGETIAEILLFLLYAQNQAPPMRR